MTIRVRPFNRGVIARYIIHDYQLKTSPLVPGRQFIEVHGGSFKGKTFLIVGTISGYGPIHVELHHRKFLWWDWVRYAASRGKSNFSLLEVTPEEHLAQAQSIGNIASHLT